MGMQVINVSVLFSALALMSADSAYVQWPAASASGSSWWTLGDNWETTVVFAVVYSQFLTSGLIFTFGSKWRKPVWENWGLFGFWLVFYVFTSWLVLSDPNEVTDVFHFASRAFPVSASPVWAAYYQGLDTAAMVNATGGNATINSTVVASAALSQTAPAMSFDLRVQIWVLTLGGMVLTVLWEFAVVVGPVRDWLHKKFPPERLHFKF
jgi:hypothetical protein